MSTPTATPESNSDPSRSFTRMESSTTRPFLRTKSKTAPDAVSLEVVEPDALPLSSSGDRPEGADVFEKRASSDSETDGGTEDGDQLLSRPQSVLDRYDELPIELLSLTDR